jgi:hypothetical protein
VKWISVKDELPEVGQSVIVLLFNSTPPVAISSVQEQTITCADHSRIDVKQWDNFFSGQVMYWMALPEVPMDVNMERRVNL